MASGDKITNNEHHQQAPQRDESTIERLFILLQQEQQVNQGHGEDSGDKMLTRFLKFNPPKFKGELDDQKAEFWLIEIEKIFRVLNYSESQKVKCATFLFEEAAHHWWQVIERKWEKEEVEGTWEEFRT